MRFVPSTGGSCGLRCNLRTHEIRTLVAPVFSTVVPTLMERGSTAQSGTYAVRLTKHRRLRPTAARVPRRTQEEIDHTWHVQCLWTNMSRSSPHSTHNGNSARPAIARLVCGHSPPTKQQFAWVTVQRKKVHTQVPDYWTQSQVRPLEERHSRETKTIDRSS